MQELDERATVSLLLRRTRTRDSPLLLGGGASASSIGSMSKVGSVGGAGGAARLGPDSGAMARRLAGSVISSTVGGDGERRPMRATGVMRRTGLTRVAGVTGRL